MPSCRSLCDEITDTRVTLRMEVGSVKSLLEGFIPIRLAQALALQDSEATVLSGKPARIQPSSPLGTRSEKLLARSREAWQTPRLLSRMKAINRWPASLHVRRSASTNAWLRCFEPRKSRW